MPERSQSAAPARPEATLVVPPFDHGLRLDSFLSKRGGDRSRSEWQRMIDLAAVLLNRRPAKASSRVAAGDRVDVQAMPAHLEPRPESDIPLDVVYQDAAIIVVNKAAGLVVHPAPGHESGTLVNALLARFPELQDPTGTLRPGIVHRLDKGTSGLMVIGKTALAVATLQAQMKQRTTVKRYLALVGGTIQEDQGQIDVPIARSLANRQKMAVRADGRAAVTDFRVSERLREWTLVEARIHTGRTHQIRVHFAYIGHPVAGDSVYGRGRTPGGLQRQFLHAAVLAFQSPLDGRLQEFQAPLPADLQAVLNTLRLEEAK